ncbi:MAG: GIY-YIG nuclease family protein [Bacteroidota bacterium]|nr:GIY-YIG nuclease family protein [Bacteroidota bacterium]
MSSRRGSSEKGCFFYAYYVYVLKSLKDNKYYIESTSNVEKRLVFHNSGRHRSIKNRIESKNEKAK